MKKEQSILELVNYIEENLDGRLATEALAKVGFVSRMQLYRDFYSAVGHTVKSYIAKRRLSVALSHIKMSDHPLADIAYLAGYSSQQSLCRAVKEELGLSPLGYRESDVYFDFPPYTGIPLHSVSIAEEHIPETLCLRFYHPCLRGLEVRAVDSLYEVLPDYNGRIFGKNGDQRANRFCYELYLTDLNCNSEKLERAGFEIGKAQPAHRRLYAAVTVPNVEDKINDAWDYLYKTWLGDSMFEHTDAPYFEEYLRNGSRGDLRPIKLKLRLPIQKRGENSRIRLVKKPDLHFVVASACGHHAEREASRCIIEYLSQHHPYSVKLSRMFYVRKDSEYAYTCGVKIGAPFQKENIHDPRICGFSTGERSYLVLESSVMGDYDRMADTLLRFAKNNRFAIRSDEIFALYDANRSYDDPKFQMYCGIKMLQNDNTDEGGFDIMKTI